MTLPQSPEQNSPEPINRVEEHLKAAIENFELFYLGNKPKKRIHSVRVSLRRTLACFELFPALNKEKRLKPIKRKATKTLEYLSELRDLDTFISFCKEQEDPNSTILKLISYSIKLRDKTIKRIRKKSFPTKFNKALRKIKPDTLVVIKQSETQDVIQEAKRKVAQHKEKTELHDLRLKVKDLSYLLDEVRQYYHKEIPVLNTLHDNQILLGNYHDLVSSKSYLKNISKKHAKKLSHKTIRQLLQLVNNQTDDTVKLWGKNWKKNLEQIQNFEVFRSAQGNKSTRKIRLAISRD
jgi:CHAD domain-containing protein